MMLRSRTPSSRLPAPYGLYLQRDEQLQFTFEGKTFTAIKGDTIASALIANRQWVLSRSFKYHRPRGILSMAGQDANTLVQLPEEANVLADMRLVEPGLVVKGQNYFGSLKWDLAAIMGWFAPFLPVGFYYRAFYKPRGAWEYWAKLIRRFAGLGTIVTQHNSTENSQDDSRYYDKQYACYEVVIVGGGAAGMSAAIEAAKGDQRVLLVEEHPLLGGSLNYASSIDDINHVNDIGDLTARTHSSKIREELVTAINTADNIEVMCSSYCNGWFSDNWLAVIKGQRLYKIRADQVVFAVGSMEQPAIFRNNDLPGIVLSSAALRLIHCYGVKAGQEAVVLCGNDEGYLKALDLVAAGVLVRAIVDIRVVSVSMQNERVKALIAKANIEVLAGCYINKAHSHASHLSAVEVCTLANHQAVAKISCDLLCMSVGYMPTFQLPLQAGGKLHYNDECAEFSIKNLPQHVHLIGSVNGIWSLAKVLVDGRRCGQLLAGIGREQDQQDASLANGSANEKNKTQDAVEFNEAPNHIWPIFPHSNGKEFVDFDEDLQIGDIINATKDGFEHVQLVKRYSTCGMGPSQGRHSALATSRLVAKCNGTSVSEVGITTARPPFTAELLSHCSGRSYYPWRYTALHQCHLRDGAVMMQAGAWYRPAYYTGQKKTGEQSVVHSTATKATMDIVAAEVNHVRNHVGIIDVSTLGGLEVRGTDAGEFLNRIYTANFAKQAINKCRYALMTNEASVIIDDGIAARLNEHHYYVTATTGGVDAVYRQMLKWNLQWGLDVDIAHVTSAYAGINIAGPKARNVLEKLIDDIDISAEGMPYMGVKQGHLKCKNAYIAVRVMRVGFVGELGFELHIPSQYGEVVWNSLLLHGKPYDVKPFGVEAQRVLRLEKGHIIIGQDTDAMSTPAEAGMVWALGKNKPYFVGLRTHQELSKQEPTRRLMGYRVTSPYVSNPPLENHLVIAKGDMIGRVTSCCFSPTLKAYIGLVWLPPTFQVGDEIKIRVADGALIAADVVDTPFYDAESLRQTL